jgi:Domain of unknown function (DUF1924)
MHTETLARLIFGLATTMAIPCPPALAATPADQQMRFDAELRAGGIPSDGFSAQRGEAFFNYTHGREWSCSSCHTSNPLAAGKHATTGKPIAPLAPAANPERFRDSGVVDKWFRRNCNDILGRPCTANEKGDVLQYLMSLK